MPNIHWGSLAAAGAWPHDCKEKRAPRFAGQPRKCAIDRRHARMIAYRHGQQPLHEYLREHARTTPDKPALVWYGRRISYAELDDLSDRFAQSLRDRGIGQGDVVAL